MRTRQRAITWIRPKRIVCTFYDPFDDQILSQWSAPFDRRKSALGHYRKRILKIKEFHKRYDGNILQGRNPRVRCRFYYE